jgi:hypothetical protein
MFSCVLLFLISIDKTWYIKFEVFQKKKLHVKKDSLHTIIDFLTILL